MFQILSTLKNRSNYKILNVKQVRYLFFTKQNAFKITSFTGSSLSTASSQLQINEPHIDLSSIDCSGVAKSVLLKCSHLLEVKKDIKSGASASLKGLLLDLSDAVPETTRKFLRVLELKPEHVLEIVLGFQYECEKVGYERGKVETLWEIFKWASEKNRGFKHLPRSCEVMAWMLMRVGMFKEVEYLVLAMDGEGVLLNGNEIFGKLIEGCISIGELERAVLVFDRMRGRGLVPSLSCYRVFIDHLVEMKRTQLAFQVCLDIMEIGVNLSDLEKACIENVVRLLCREGKIQESRNLVRKVLAFGLEPSGFLLNEIACGYCEKKDFEDLLSFFIEMKCAPDILTGNKTVHTLCCIFGVDRADFFMQELECLGFRPDEITFGILIGWSCREGNLRSSFIYLSEIFSRGLNPNARSYSSLISVLFKEGMWKHANDILDEMVNNGTHPTLSIYRLLLAGYCKARQFDEARVTISEMDPLSKAFEILGLNPLTVRLRRDNDVGFSKTEFFDNLGNGLYLDTDQDEFDKRVTKILEDSMIPDFNSLVMVECAHRNLKAAQLLVNEMDQWGQELSLSVFSALVKDLCASRSHIKACTILFEKLPKLANQLDQETLNLLVQACCKKGLVHSGKVVFFGMLQRNLTIKNETYTALLTGLCKKGILRDLHDCWNIAINKNWLPGLEDSKKLVECLCHRKMLKEALVLLEHMLEFYPYLRSDICHVFLEKLCVMGFSTAAHALVEQLFQQGCNLGQMAYSHVIKGLCEEKKISVAVEVLDSMLAKNMAPCWDICLILIPRLLRAGKVEEASSVFQDMLSKGLPAEAELCNMLIEGHCRVNNTRNVRELLSVIIRKKLSLSISCYRNCVRWMCMEGRVPWAFSLKELMLGQNNTDNLVIYNILVFYLLSSGNKFLVNKVLNELVENRLLPDEVTYNFLVYGFSKCKYVSGSVQYLSTMISEGLKPSNRSLRTVISCLCDVGELGKALQLSQEMILKGWVHDSIIQNSIVEGLLSRCKLQEAEHFLHSIVDKGLIPNTINYDRLIKRFCGYGRLNKAVDLLNIMLKKGNVPNSASYDSVIQGFCTRNKLDQALNFHTEMLARDLKPSTNTWNTLVRRLCQEGHTAEAEKLLISMIHIGETPTREMYSCVANRYCLENNLKKASELMQAMQRSGHSPDFSSHWSLISNLSNSSDKASSNDNSQGFLSRLLSGSGFSWRKDSKTKRG
ncbi:hypothetical protein Patl1_21885 [Pistacia atlantica]|uniref:Uncharacterized protein n=1 Tax=Pistacia atlantica TaxID=434234 RepID=A0ACC1BI17_9ROSI|nr:hypothetical protein Patl1_21885 [Pistacia atlantica]